MIEVDDFKLVQLKDQDLFKKHYEQFPPRHSDYSFIILVSWKDYMEYYYTFQDECIIIMTKCGEKIQVRPPIGHPSVRFEQGVMELARELGTEPPYGVIDEVAMKRLNERYSGLHFEPHRDFFDYVYLAQDLDELSGKKYIKIRNVLNRFKKRYEYTTEPITDDNLDEVCKFLERWCLWKDCDKIPLLNSEKLALFYCMEHFDELGLLGLAIRIDGNIEAAAIYHSLNQNTAVIHFEKAIPDFEGLYQAINQETAKILSETYQFINREPDMGFPGLRIAKQKYKPHHMVEVYHLNMAQLNSI